MIPLLSSAKKFVQTNFSSLMGDFYATKGLDFDTNIGAIQLAPRLILNSSTSDLSDMILPPVAFKAFDNGTGTKIYTIAGKTEGSGIGYLYQGGVSPDVTPFTEIIGGSNIASVDSQISDLEVFNGELWVTGDGVNVYYLDNSNSWANTTSHSTANGYARPLCNFRYLGRIYTAIDGYKVTSSASDHLFASIGAANTVTIQAFPSSGAVNEVITFIKEASQSLWIGTVNITGGRGAMYQWDGVSTQWQKRYVLEATGALSCVIKNDVPYIVDSNGDLRVFNGSTFVYQTGFFRKNNIPFYNFSFKTNKRFIHPNGMTIVDGDIHILVDLTNNDAASHAGTQEDCNPSGVYVYDESTKSLKHKYSFGLTKAGATITDYGAARIWRAGGISWIPSHKDYAANTGNGTLLFGCSYYTDATTTQAGIFYDDLNDTLAKGGIFITPKIYASATPFSITDAWNKLYVQHQKFLNASDRMVVKYRTTEDVPVEGAITWVSTTGFTTTANLSTYSIGDEVEIVQGIGSGFCSHITAIQSVSGGYMVTVDETYTSATGTSRARFAKWTKAGTIQDLIDWDEVPIGVNTTWIQFKVMLLWTGKNELNKVLLTNAESQLTQ